MRMEEAFYNIFIYLYNKNILEYPQYARNGTESEIPYIESHSIIFSNRLVSRDEKQTPYFTFLGPANWIGVCQTGRSQSPIDIPSINLQQETEKPFIFHGYDSSALRKKGTLFNAGGHTLQLNAGSYLANTAPSVSKEEIQTGTKVFLHM